MKYLLIIPAWWLGFAFGVQAANLIHLIEPSGCRIQVADSGILFADTGPQDTGTLY